MEIYRDPPEQPKTDNVFTYKGEQFDGTSKRKKSLLLVPIQQTFSGRIKMMLQESYWNKLPTIFRPVHI